jgi:hypothetical protein
MTRVLSSGLIVTLALGSSASAQCPTQTGKLVPTLAPTSGQAFGVDVAVFEGRAVVGSENREQAYVYERDASGAWVEVAQLTPASFFASNAFGDTVAVGTDTVAVGGLDVIGGVAETVLYLFEEDPLTGEWQQTQTITPGQSAAFAGETLVVAGDDQLQFLERGPTGDWGVVQSVPTGTGFLYGFTVAADGDTAMVSAARYLSLCYGCPAEPVYVYQRRNGVWQLAQQLRESDALGDTANGFGWAIDVLGDTAVVTRPGNTYQHPSKQVPGQAFVYERTRGRWQRVATLTAAVPAAQDFFGRSLALTPGGLYVGAPGTDAPVDSGSVFAFARSGGSWPFVCELKANNPSFGDTLGSSLGAYGGALVVGCPGDDTLMGPLSGSALLFDAP